MTSNISYWVEGASCCNEQWEDAYNRFETEAEEIAKFRKRLHILGASKWHKQSRIVDLFCGSGRNLTCLQNMGFSELHGVDLSPRLLERYVGQANLYVGDATQLQFPDNWADIVIVQGGLHHLSTLPDDLDKCLDQIHRILNVGGKLVVVEPWLTPMLRFAHWCCDQRFLTNSWPKLKALADMTREESDTYFRWLGAGREIATALNDRFETEFERTRFGKLMYIGVRR